MNINFEKATLKHKDTVLDWLEKEHVKEFWDNSLEHRQDILIFMNGRKEPTPYFNGMFDYWIGTINNEPFCLIMTSEVVISKDLPKILLDNISKTGKTFGFDFMIGNEKYLGKGLGALTLEKFAIFFKKSIEPKTDLYIIDPEINNSKAIHVYKKAGFNVIGEFERRDKKFILMIKKIYDTRK